MQVDIRAIGPIVIGALAPAVAHAFCGAYVGGAGAELYNESSAILLARDGNRTTLTVSNDFEGDATEFGFVIPIPEVLVAENVRTVDPSVFANVDLYSAPRSVAYTCEEAFSERRRGMGGCGMTFGCSADSMTTGMWDTAADGVVVEAQFDVSEYEIAVLSATGAEGLTGWLGANGFVLPEGSEGVFQEYIDGGSYFLAAKVDAASLPPGGWLSPLQFSYTAEAMSLPVRLGTVSSRGFQDMLLYVLTHPAEGEVGIANYPELALEDECMWQGDDFGSFYLDALRDAMLGSDRAGWLVEYSWAQQPPATPNYVHCDPCVTPPEPEVQGDTVRLNLAQLGFPYEAGHFTRLHMRYRPEQIDEDLVLYASGLTDASQQRFIEYKRELEFLLPVCGEGYVDEPGMCGDALDPNRPPPAGCAVQPVPIAAFGLAGFGLILLRRRR